MFDLSLILVINNRMKPRPDPPPHNGFLTFFSNCELKTVIDIKLNDALNVFEEK